MHTPGQELFDGMVHPSAGLFEDYFDSDKAADEHRGYIEKLGSHGIKVHTVIGLLKKAPAGDLRALASESMKYGLNSDAGETAAEEAYRQRNLAAMGRSDLIRCIMLRPTAELHPTEDNTGVRARYIHNPLMNLYFTRDQSITTPRGHIICRMNSVQRAAETSIIELCYKLLGRSPVLRITGKGRLEGGDYFPAGDFSAIGCGMRTNMEAIRQIMAADAFGHDTVVIVHDRKRWQPQMHLDTYFNLIDKDLCTLAQSRLKAAPGDREYLACDIYERAEKGYRKAAAGLPFPDFLRSRGFRIIPVEGEDETRYANNFLTIAPRRIMAVAGQSEAFAKALDEAGVQVEWLPLDNLICGYGAAHCMTQVLLRG